MHGERASRYAHNCGRDYGGRRVFGYWECVSRGSNRTTKRLTSKCERRVAKREIPALLAEPELDDWNERNLDDYCMDRMCEVCYGPFPQYWLDRVIN